MNKASIFVVIVMYSSRNSSSRPLYSVVNSAVHPTIQVASSLYEIGGSFFVQFTTAFLGALKYAIKMQVAHDGPVEKRENKNRKFSLYFHRFEKGVFTQKSIEYTIYRFRLLTA